MRKRWAGEIMFVKMLHTCLKEGFFKYYSMEFPITELELHTSVIDNLEQIFYARNSISLQMSKNSQNHVNNTGLISSVMGDMVLQSSFYNFEKPNFLVSYITPQLIFNSRSSV